MRLCTETAARQRTLEMVYYIVRHHWNLLIMIHMTCEHSETMAHGVGANFRLCKKHSLWLLRTASNYEATCRAILESINLGIKRHTECKVQASMQKTEVMKAAL